MIDFHKIALTDKQWIKTCFEAKAEISCEYSFGNLFGYSHNTDIYVAECFGCMVSKWDYDDIAYYSFPIGPGDTASAIKAVVEDAEKKTKKCQIFGMTEEDSALFDRIFSGKYKSAPNRNAFDYVYNTENLISLKGKKYQPKRNHISYFERNNDWQYETITEKNIPECLEMSRVWLGENHTSATEELEDEFTMIKALFSNFKSLDFVGGLIRANGRVIAYSMGEALDSETFCVHIEKAFPEIRGAYPMINREFVKNELQSYKYINREDDLGLEHLRKAKLSYHPAFLFEKYEASVNG